MTTMVSIHRVKSITKRTNIHDNGTIAITLSIQDENDNKSEVTFFGEDFKEMAFVDSEFSDYRNS
tara:strand:+ start:53 stop:247 length:195 start_codon:yes stop_codon:yes gene_type:complete